MGASSYSPKAGEVGQEELWSSLVNQSSLIDEPKIPVKNLVTSLLSNVELTSMCVNYEYVCKCFVDMKEI